MKMFAFVILFLSLCSFTLPAKSIYVSTTGFDTSSGTIDLPLKSISKALASSIHPGDSIIVRGGVYSLTATISINPIGKQDSLCYLFAFPGERPILDFSAMAVSGSNRGIQLKGNYWYLKGLDIKGAGDNGMNVSGSNNIVEYCALYENRDSGMQLGGGASNNKIINCDSYFNRDPGEGNADGFSPKLDVGTNNYFYGCRSWQNSDDGFDGYLRPSDDVTTTYENCWCFKNGYRKDGTASTGNGNGFKMGGSDNKTLMHNAILYNCLSFDNRVKGFDQNNNKGSMTLINCTAYNNGENFAVVSELNTGKVLTVTNCLALGSYGFLIPDAVLTTNSWMRSDSVTLSDFLSIDTSGVRGARKPDGSLPDITFMHLTSFSPLIDAGTIVPGRPFNGSAPDLGCFESGPPTPVELTSFTANSTTGKVTLGWSTATEINNRGFEIQRKANDNNWIVIAFKNGNGTTTNRHNYSFTDNIAALNVNKIYYRLRQYDFNGQSQYSPVILIDNIIPETFNVAQNFPNPFNPSTVIVYQIPVASHVNLTIFNILGKEITTLVNENKPQGTYYLNFNAANLASGVYLYTLKTDRFAQTKKMILLK